MPDPLSNSAPPSAPTADPNSTPQTPPTEGTSGMVQPATAPAPRQGLFGRLAGGFKNTVTNTVMHPMQAAQAAEQATFGHDAMIGRAAKSLLGAQSSYQVGPDGTIQQVAQPSAPGDMFRHILAGVLLGGAAGGQAKGGFVGGLAAGGGAAVENNQKQDQVKFGQAEQDFKNQQEVQNQRQENLYRQAQIAQDVSSDMRADATMDLQQQDRIDKLNAANQLIQENAQEKGALASVPVNGKNINGVQGNGAQLAAMYQKDPSLGQAPQGYHRIHTQTVDHDGLTFKSEVGPDHKAIHGWFDADGKQVDLSTRTTHSLYDIPDSIWNQAVTKSGEDLNKLAGVDGMFTKGQNYTLTNGELLSLKGKSTEDGYKASEAAARMIAVRAQAAEAYAKIKEINQNIELGKNSPTRQDMALINDQLLNAERQLHDEKQNAGGGDPRTMKDLEDFLVTNRQNLADLQRKIDGLPPIDRSKQSAPDIKDTPAGTTVPANAQQFADPKSGRQIWSTDGKNWYWVPTAAVTPPFKSPSDPSWGSQTMLTTPTS